MPTDSGAKAANATAVTQTSMPARSSIARATLGFIAKVQRSSFGGFGERRITRSVGLSFPRGSDLQTVDAAMREFEHLSVGRPEVEQVRASSRGMGAQMFVTFTPSGGLTSAPPELQKRLTQRAMMIGGANVSVSGQGPRFSSGGGGTSSSAFRLRS